MWETGTRPVFPTGAGGSRQQRHPARRRRGAETSDNSPSQPV